MTAPRIIFYDWPYSPFCMKVRAILDYKRLDYEVVNPLAVRRRLIKRGTGKVPAIEINGDFVTDSTDIAYALNETFGDPPLLPHDERGRGLCHALEDWADESLYFIGLYYRWFEEDGRKPIPLVFGNSVKGRMAYRFYLRLVLGQIKAQGTLRKSPEHVARDFERHLHAIDGLLKPGPYLMGEQPYLCDFAVWGQLTYLNRTPVGGEMIDRHPGILAYLERMRPGLPGGGTKAG